MTGLEKEVVAASLTSAHHVSHFVLATISMLLYTFAGQLVWYKWQFGVLGVTPSRLPWLSMTIGAIATCSASAVIPMTPGFREAIYWIAAVFAFASVWTNQARVIAILIRDGR